MGAVLGSIGSSMATSLACCFAQQATTCLCSVLRPSVATRVWYTFYFLIATILSWALFHFGTRMPNTVTAVCDADCWSYLAVMRVSFSMVLFHALLAVITFGVRNTRDWRANVQNGYWFIKFACWIAILTGCFYMDPATFYNYWVAAIIFSALFVLHQSFLLVDFAWSWAQRWIEQWELTLDDWYKHMLLFCCSLFYVATLLSSILLLVYFGPPGKPDCALNTYFVVLNLVLVVAHSITSILPRIQNATPKSGIFQSSILGVYTTYLIASAIASEPSEGGFQCGLTSMNPDSDSGNQPFASSMVYVGVFLTFLALGYSAFSTGSSTILFEQLRAEEGEVEDGGPMAVDDELVMAAFYMSMVLTDWRIMEANPAHPNGVAIVHGFGAMWVKVATSWVCTLLYIWTLVAPLLFPDRDFSV